MIWFMRLIGVAIIVVGFAVAAGGNRAGDVVGVIGCVWLVAFLFVGGRRS